MPLHSAASFLDNASSSEVFYGAVGLLALYAVKAWAGGRKCTWEREWAGKMIWVVVCLVTSLLFLVDTTQGPPSPTVLALLDYLLQLPSPPQILYLPPYPSPLPESLLTVLHTLRLGITSPLAQLHCEPLPCTHRGVRDFTQKWAKVQQGTAGEGGRRVDAIVLASGWEVQPYLTRPVDTAEDPDWSVHQFHFHLITSLLPCLIRQPAERNIRIVNLVSPTWSAALPSLHGTKPVDSLVQLSGRRSITTLYLMQHFQLILDTLASSTYGSSKPVPDPNGEVKQRDKNIQSNIMAISVIMSWARSEVIRGSMGADDSLLLWVL